LPGWRFAYLLNPIAGRNERLGILLVTLFILVVVVVIIAVLVALILPMIVSEISHLIEKFSMYLRRLQTLTTDPN
jgi:predicted PurR-regulated permease PerM